MWEARAAAKALGLSTEREVVGAKKRVLSAAGIAAIVKAAKKRWAKVRAQTPKAAQVAVRVLTLGRVAYLDPAEYRDDSSKITG